MLCTMVSLLKEVCSSSGMHYDTYNDFYMSDSDNDHLLSPFNKQGYERDEIDQRAEYQSQRGGMRGHSHGGFGGFSGFG